MKLKLVYTLFSILLLPANLHAQKITVLLEQSSLNCLNKTLRVVEKNSAKAALRYSELCQDDAINELLMWQTINKQQAIDANQALNFLVGRSYLPEYQKLFRNLEAQLNSKVSVDNLDFFYSNFQPRSQNSFKLYQEVFAKNNELSQEFTKGYFLSKAFPVSKAHKFISEHAEIIDKKIIKQKIASLIRSRDYNDSKKFFKYLNKNEQKLFRTQTAFAKNYSRAPKYLKSLPDNYENDEDLIYYIIRWFERRDRDSQITQYLLNLEPEVNPQRWYKIRLRNARHLLQENKPNTAYQVITNHNIKEPGVALAELEWFAGWLALRHLDKPRLAIRHFKTMHDNVNYAISKSRASYWLGRAYAANKNNLAANEWFVTASNYTTSFYGQMALLELNNELMISLPTTKIHDPVELRFFIAEENLLRIALYHAYLGNAKISLKFFKQAILNDPEPERIKKIISLASYSKNAEIINEVGRLATRFNVLSLANYPVVQHLPKADLKQQALIMAIIRQESGFNVSAKSSAGAVGYMQLMPATAREVARRMRVSYSKNKLSKNAAYNIKLGSYYINMLLKQYRQSYILASSAYNAGPRSTKNWLKQNGDPRKLTDKHKIIDWIELISFAETRNYVQRILENTVIYTHILNQQAHFAPENINLINNHNYITAFKPIAKRLIQDYAIPNAKPFIFMEVKIEHKPILQ